MGKSETGKTEVIYCRVNETLKKRLEAEVRARDGEAEAVIVREALREYFDRRDHPDKYPPLRGGQHYEVNEPARPAATPQDVAAGALGKRAVEEITGHESPAARAARIDRKFADKSIQVARKSVREKHGK